MNDRIKEKVKGVNSNSLRWYGVFVTIVGLFSLVKPKFYFRGAEVDLTGYNFLVGIIFIIVGIFSIYISNRKSKNNYFQNNE